jgi:hypothetical protein
MGRDAGESLRRGALGQRIRDSAMTVAAATPSITGTPNSSLRSRFAAVA